MTHLLNGEDVNVSVRKGRGSGGVARKSEAGSWRQHEAGDEPHSKYLCQHAGLSTGCCQERSPALSLTSEKRNLNEVGGGVP